MSTNYYKKSIDAFENFKEEPRNKYGEYRTPDLEPKKTDDPVPVVETANVEPVEVVEEAVEVKEPKKSKKSKVENASDDITDAIFGSEVVEETAEEA